jgi:molecular chaperone GrpE
MVSFESVRINDRRRFHPDGEPREDTPSETAETSVAEPTRPASAPEPAGEVEALRSELVAARARVNELARGLQDSVRDRDAFKERLVREQERLRDVEKGQNARLVIDAIDALDLSLQADDGSPLARGVRLIRDDLVAKLAAQGVERLKLAGAPFDPTVAEAVDTELVAEPAEDGRVLSEVRAGYALKGRVVRPAQVRVGRYLTPAQA